MRTLLVLLSLAAGVVLAQPGAGFAAIPGAKGGQDAFGPYDIAKGWPKDISTVAGNEKWTYGSAESVYAESPNRVFMLFRGELPVMRRPPTKQLSDMGPSLQFPIGRLPWRDATVASPPGGGAGGTPAPPDLTTGWKGTLGVDAKWENCIVVADANGNIVERWTQWDKILQRPHFVAINPYDPEKHVWIVDDHMQSIYKFSHDGKKLEQTIGTPRKSGADGSHFDRPTYLAWLPDSTMFVADGYNGTRVAKFDKNGKFLLDWGKKGTPPDKRPGYFNNVHGIAVDPQTRRVFVNDRGNKRIQVFDENGKYLNEWSMGADPSDIHLIYIGADRTLWTADRGTSKMLKYDLDGHFLYSWGTWGDFPGGFWGVHGFSVDQEGNFYTAEVDSGRAQKFTPKAGANPAFLVGKPVYSAWK
jgi:6-phosphogluconolactonase (cycloisomerase 2 family)